MPTLTQLRGFVAKHLGAYQAGLADPTSTQSVLVDLAWPVHTSLVVDQLWSDGWIYRPNASAASDRVRVVKTYSPSTGQLTPDLSWTNAPTQNEPYELHAVIEPYTVMTDLINNGLKRCMLAVEIATTPVYQSTEHNVSVIAPWIEDQSWVRQIGYLSSIEDRNQMDPFVRVVRGDVREDHKSIVLDHYPQSFRADDVLYLKLMKRAYDDCSTASGQPGDQSGLVAETDKVPGSLEWLGWAAIVEAWESYSHVLETAARARLVPDRLEAAAKFTVQNRINAKWPLQTYRPLLAGGPRQGRQPTAYRATSA